MKKYHAIRHRKLAARRRHADRARAIRADRFRRLCLALAHGAKRRAEFERARLHRWAGATFVPPSFAGSNFAALIAARMMMGARA